MDYEEGADALELDDEEGGNYTFGSFPAESSYSVGAPSKITQPMGTRSEPRVQPHVASKVHVPVVAATGMSSTMTGSERLNTQSQLVSTARNTPGIVPSTAPVSSAPISVMKVAAPVTGGPVIPPSRIVSTRPAARESHSPTPAEIAALMSMPDWTPPSPQREQPVVAAQAPVVAVAAKRIVLPVPASNTGPPAAFAHKAAWRRACEAVGLGVDSFFPSERLAEHCNLGMITQQPTCFSGILQYVQLLVFVRSLAVTDSDAHGLVEDLTGKISAVFTRQVLDEHGSALRVGSVLLLRGTSVFLSPNGAQHLNIAADSIVALWPPTD